MVPSTATAKPPSSGGKSVDLHRPNDRIVGTGARAPTCPTHRMVPPTTALPRVRRRRHPPRRWAIRRVFQRRALWPNLLKLLDAEIRFARNEAEKAELLVEKGQLLEDRLADVAAARDCYLKAADAHPSTIAAWTSLEKLYAKDG